MLAREGDAVLPRRSLLAALAGQHCGLLSLQPDRPRRPRAAYERHSQASGFRCVHHDDSSTLLRQVASGSVGGEKLRACVSSDWRSETINRQFRNWDALHSWLRHLGTHCRDHQRTKNELALPM